MNSQLENKLAHTPETDRRIITQDPRMCGCGYKSEIVFADLARRLERERNEIREKVWELTTLLQEHGIIGYND